MAKRFALRAIIPGTHQMFMQLLQAVANSGIDKLHQELIKIRASQINGCAYCLHKHSKDAITMVKIPKGCMC